MAKLSRGTKETIKTILVVVVIIVLVLIYVVYPLNRTKAAMARTDLETWEQDTMPANDYGAFAAEGWALDTFRVESDGIANLACVSIVSDTMPRGLAIVIPDERATRDSVLPIIREFLGQGFSVVTYDQRASGRSTGRYHNDGQLEANDLQAIISHLEIHSQVRHPMVVVGYAGGGDAVLLTAIEEKRIDALAAINPYLSTERLINTLRERHGMLWIPFFKSVFWWWYNIRSGYTTPYRDEGDVAAPERPGFVLLPEATNDETLTAFREAASEQLVIRSVTTTESQLVSELIGRAGNRQQQ